MSAFEKYYYNHRCLSGNVTNDVFNRIAREWNWKTRESFRGTSLTDTNFFPGNLNNFPILKTMDSREEESNRLPVNTGLFTYANVILRNSLLKLHVTLASNNSEACSLLTRPASWFAVVIAKLIVPDVYTTPVEKFAKRLRRFEGDDLQIEFPPGFITPRNSFVLWCIVS